MKIYDEERLIGKEVM